MLQLFLLSYLPLLNASSPSSSAARASGKKYALERDMALKADHLCANPSLAYKPKISFIYNLSFLLLKICFKYGLLAQKTNKDVGTVLNVLSTFNA